MIELGPRGGAGNSTHEPRDYPMTVTSAELN